MDQAELQEQIDRYLSQQMAPSERSAFEVQLQQDAALAQRVELERDVNATLKDTKGLALEIDLKAMGDEFAQKYSDTKTAAVKPLWGGRRKWLLAASVLLLLSLWFVQRSYMQADTTQLYAQAYEPYIATQATRSFNTAQEDAFNQALTFYQNGNYKEALSAFNNLAQNDNLSNDNHLTLQFYQGLAQMALGDVNRAAPHFQVLVQENQNLYVQQSRWYLALCYLKQGTPEKTKLLLQEIMEESTRGKYFHLAKSLLEKMG